MISRKTILFLVLVTIASKMIVLGQSQISGIVKEKGTLEVLIGANVYSPELQIGTATDNNGYFNMVLPTVADSLCFSYVGFESKCIHSEMNKDTVVTILLNRSFSLEEVEIYRTQKRSLNISTLSRDELMNIPSIGSEPDIMKTLQLLPGIQTQNEGSSNLLVRGGGPGQNLFLLDNIPLFYVNHLGGFISVFNPEIINNVTIYKGGFPARYGGKLSSIIDITLREGDKSEFKGSAGIGVTGANLTVEGPIGGKASYLFTTRKTFTELLMWGMSLLADQEYIARYGFYDLNGKIVLNPDQNNQFQFNIYTGDDQLNIYQYIERNDYFKMQNKWGNIMTSASWKHIYSPGLYSTSSISMTRYRIKDYFESETIKTDSTVSHQERTNLSCVQDISVKTDWKYRISRNYAINFGLHSSLLNFIPSRSWETEEEKTSKTPGIIALENSVYIENNINIGTIALLNIGFRGVNYIGENYIDFKLEPRIEATVNLSQNQYLQFTYSKVNQYAHMIFASGSIVNNEVWVPTTEGMSPEKSTQITGGWKGSFMIGMYEAEINGYFKRMQELIEFKNGYSSIIGDTHWSTKIESGGNGRSEGLELFARKTRGTWSGFLSYAYSHTSRQFENINGGLEYIYEYDRPHTFSIDINRKISGKIVLNIAWVYQTGLPYTPSIGIIYLPEINSLESTYNYEALVYGERNSERMRDYHRLDLALNYKKKTKNGRDGVWTFSVYNAYNRHNAYYYFYNTQPRISISNYKFDKQEPLNLYQFSFFPIIPSLSYKVKF